MKTVKWISLLVLTLFSLSFTHAEPVKLQFNPPDPSRPLGIWHLSDPTYVKADNPGGWNISNGVTPGGSNDWQDSYINGALPTLKRIRAQGVLIWDIEGSSLGADFQYVGCPDIAQSLNPKVDYKRLFRRLKNEGLTYGVCVRGNQEFVNGKAVFPDNQYESLRRRIAYAKSEWGVNWIYIDSNIRQNIPDVPNGWVEGWLTPNTVWARLSTDFPDVWLIPEHKDSATHIWTIPYHALNLGQVDIGRHVAKDLPSAVGFINCSAVSAERLRELLPMLRLSIRARNVLAIDAWNDTAESQVFAELYK